MSLLALADRALAAAPIAAHYRWRVALPDGRVIKACFVPELTRPEVESRYPGARAEPLPEAAAPVLAANDPTVDPNVLRRRARALAMLEAEPERPIAVVAEAGDPAHVAVAIRGTAVGELTIPADRYHAFALLALMQQYGHA